MRKTINNDIINVWGSCLVIHTALGLNSDKIHLSIPKCCVFVEVRCYSSI